MSMKAPTDCSARGTHANRRREAWILAHPAKAYMPAFTLIELLAVIAIIAVMAAMIFPQVSRVKAGAMEARCLGNLKQILTATVAASNDNNGNFPRYDTGESGVPWMQDFLWSYLNSSPKPSSVPIIGTVYLCPAAWNNAKQGWMRYNGGNYRYNVWFAPDKRPQYKWSEAVVLFDKQWGDWAPDTWSHFPGPNPIVNFAYADGHVASLTYKDCTKQPERLWAWGGGAEIWCPVFRNGWIQ